MNARVFFPFLVILVLAPLCGLAAQSKDEQNLQRETARLDKTAATPQGEHAVIARLTRDFSVTEADIASLRAKGLSYGEVAVALSCAKSMPGGATDGNIGKVAGLRQGPPALGWNDIARQVNVKLGACVSQVKKVNNESHREMKKERTAGAKPASPEADPAGPKAQSRHFTGEGKSLPQGSAAQ